MKPGHIEHARRELRPFEGRNVGTMDSRSLSELFEQLCYAGLAHYEVSFEGDCLVRLTPPPAGRAGQQVMSLNPILRV